MNSPRNGETWREYVMRLAITANREEECKATLNALCHTMTIEEAATKTIEIWELRRK